MTIIETLQSLNPFKSINHDIEKAKGDLRQNAQAIRSGTEIINRKASAVSRELKMVAEVHDLMRKRNDRKV